MRFTALWAITLLAWDSVAGLPIGGGGSPPPPRHPLPDRGYTATLDANVIWSGTPLAEPNNRRSVRDFALGAGAVMVVSAGHHYYVNNIRERPWSGTPIDLENNPNDSLEPFLEKHRKLLECIGKRTALKPGVRSTLSLFFSAFFLFDTPPTFVLDICLPFPLININRETGKNNLPLEQIQPSCGNTFADFYFSHGEFPGLPSAPLAYMP
jgi:hypothetical protein